MTFPSARTRTHLLSVLYIRSTCCLCQWPLFDNHGNIIDLPKVNTDSLGVPFMDLVIVSMTGNRKSNLFKRRCPCNVTQMMCSVKYDAQRRLQRIEAENCF